jgi:flagellar biosynthesis/type III secretory pathway protein FliH
VSENQGSFKSKLEAKAEEMRDHLQDGAERFGQGMQREAKGVDQRIKDGIQSAIEEGKQAGKRLGRHPGVTRRPPSGRPPTGRPPSIRP